MGSIGRRIVPQVSQGKNVRPYLKNNCSKKRARDGAQLVENLPRVQAPIPQKKAKNTVIIYQLFENT
jgi:hypothetical protein